MILKCDAQPYQETKCTQIKFVTTFFEDDNVLMFKMHSYAQNGSFLNL